MAEFSLDVDEIKKDVETTLKQEEEKLENSNIKNQADENAVAIFEADLGLTPNNNGETVMLVIPELTEERRKEYVKEAKSLAEDAKIALRNIRQDANSAIKKLEIPEDNQKSAQEDVQELINKYNKIVDEKLKVKEQELMEI